jgi:DNA-binding IclR family transcriptional regulator
MFLRLASSPPDFSMASTKKIRQRSYAAPALDKGLDILETLSQAQSPLTINDLAGRLRRTRNEIFRMLDNLQRRSYITRDPVSGAYGLTLRLYELAHNHSPVDHLLRASYVPMQNLAESIRESCHLSVLNRGMLVVIASTESPEPVRLSVEVGYRVVPLKTVSGLVLLSAVPPTERGHFLRADKYYGALTPAGKKALHKKFDLVGKNRYHLAPSTRRTGLDCACLVGNPSIGVTAALGVPFIAGGASEGREQTLIATIQQTAYQITSALGLSTTATPASS